MTLPAWTKEPLVQFLLGGALLYGLLTWSGNDIDPESRVIEVSREQQAQLALQFERTLQRAPTDAELDTLIEQFVREEVLYREALRLGLDNDDAIVRRRMSQKMDMIAASEAETAIPNEATLQAWLDKYPSRFAQEVELSFDQLWFGQRAEAKAALEALRRGADWQSLGQQIDLPPITEARPRREIANRFGQQFAAALDGFDTGESWQGPVPSGFGFHLVRLRARDAGEPPSLESVRDRVLADWRSETIAERKDQAYRVLREAYRVEIDR